MPTWAAVQGRPNEICVPLNDFDTKTLELTCASTGVMKISASRDSVQDTGKGQRKISSILEETVELPKYLVDEGLLDKVESVVENNLVVISFPAQKPQVITEKSEPVKVNIKLVKSEPEKN